GWSGQKATSGSNVATPNLTTTTTFSLRCHGAGGWSPIQSVTVNVGAQVVAPTFTFGANTTSVSYNAPAYLSWSTSGNADYCEASDGWSGQRGTSGSNVGISITGTTYFTLRCHGAGGWSPSQTIVVNVTYPTTPTIYYFAANSTSISYNTPAYLSWSASGDSDYCEASNGWSGQRATSGSGVAIYITGTTNFTLRCHGAGGWSPYQTVTVYTSNPVSSLFTVTFTVNGTTVPYNTPAYLSWNTSGSADYCEASNGWNGQRATSGSNVATQNLTGTTSFSIRCYGGGSWSPYQTVVVNVTSPTAPTISYFSVAPTTVSYNTPAYLSWSASGDSDYCEASNGWSGQRATSGSGVATPNLTTTTTFSLRCHGAGGWSPIQSVTVNVGARPIVQTAMLASIVPIISNAPKIKIETPAIKLACNPGTCVGYHGVAQGGVGSLNVISSPQNGAYVSCGVQIDNEKQKAVQCDKSLSVLVSDRNVGAHTFILTNVDASGNKKKTTLFFRIKENIKPKLTCSFDAITWKPCKEIQPTVGVGVYVRDTSLPSTGARITSRKLQAIPGVQPGAVAAELALFKPTSSGVKLIQLSVSDSAGRTGNVVDLLYVKEGPANVCKPVEILSTTVK
ncbi:MAG: hypothetical protein HZA35_00090, partial [Parcubacteria group bacterium]|nr:hypothetical protein [Parcubacteria group bacterium]